MILDHSQVNMVASNFAAGARLLCSPWRRPVCTFFSYHVHAVQHNFDAPCCKHSFRCINHAGEHISHE